uniref:Uncharacterized protein n=1 Tax=Solanum lycopersicum TaxID=4081 RepID=A0A494G8I6_SOLLC
MTSTWTAIFTVGLHTRTDNVGHGKRSLPLFFIYSRMNSSVAFHHGALTTHKVVLRNAWHGIIALG